MHSFWCWINRKSQERIVLSARRELMKHLANMHLLSPGAIERWYQRRDSLRMYLLQEQLRLDMIGGSIPPVKLTSYYTLHFSMTEEEVRRMCDPNIPLGS